ncbi:hypothetical protein LP414_22865 [Polaromonas sp. P1(28)-13]|nr:hypothetical protein LP414_22865 [Polaromonas sp. P1(28)-13]
MHSARQTAITYGRFGHTAGCHERLLTGGRLGNQKAAIGDRQLAAVPAFKSQSSVTAKGAKLSSAPMELTIDNRTLSLISK